MFKIFDKRFNLVVVHEIETARTIALFVKSMGAKVLELKETDIVDSDGCKQVEVYILVCSGSHSVYKKIKQFTRMTEIVYEGSKTLI